MIRFVLFMSLVSVSWVAVASDSDMKASVGVGVGSAYSGLGANLALLSNSDMKYISVGCVGYSSNFGSTCGFGAGWIVTNLFRTNSNKHGVGVYVTKAGSERYLHFDENGSHFVDREYYGAGVSYTYFTRGINTPGFNFGISTHATNAKYNSSVRGFLTVGYQF